MGLNAALKCTEERLCGNILIYFFWTINHFKSCCAGIWGKKNNEELNTGARRRKVGLKLTKRFFFPQTFKEINLYFQVWLNSR